MNQNNLLDTIDYSINIERRNDNGQEEFFLVGQLINGVQFHYQIEVTNELTNNGYLIEKRIEKVIYRDGQ